MEVNVSQVQSRSELDLNSANIEKIGTRIEIDAPTAVGPGNLNKLNLEMVDKNESSIKTKKISLAYQTQQNSNPPLCAQGKTQVTNLKAFKCNLCLSSFQYLSILKKHEKTHSTAPRFQCQICSKPFKTKTAYLNHMLTVHEEKVGYAKYFDCTLCTSKFLSKRSLELHVLSKHVVDKPFPCHVCSKNFIDKETLAKHMTRHNTECKYFCDICSAGFRVKRSLWRHLGIAHAKFFYCEKCLKSYKNKSEFDQHLNLKFTLEHGLKFQCQIRTCQQFCSSQCNLDIHMQGHLKETGGAEIGAKVTSEHVKGHNTNADADALTAIVDEVQTGDSVKTGEFKCELCPKTFDREAYIVAHRKLVHPNSVWKCSQEQCSKTFKMHHQLKIHELKHLETKPHVCQTCQKSFYRPWDLKVHEQVHSSEKAHKCTVCLKSFSFSHSLKIHMDNCHTGNKPFTCHICGIPWVLQSHLNVHLLSHSEERMHGCDKCPKSFKHKKHLVFHKLNIHERKSSK